MMMAAVRVIFLVSVAVSSSHAGTGRLEIKQMCGEDSVLTCKATREAGVQYRDTRWYKVSEGPESGRVGLIRKKLANHTVHRYAGIDRMVGFLPNSSDLVLPNVTAEDSGLYSCVLSGPVGNRNQEGLIYLSVSGCPEDTLSKDLWLEIILFITLILSLVTCFICWICLRNLSILRQSRKQDLKEKTLLHKKSLKLIYSPDQKGSPYHHVCV